MRVMMSLKISLREGTQSSLVENQAPFKFLSHPCHPSLLVLQTIFDTLQLVSMMLTEEMDADNASRVITFIRIYTQRRAMHTSNWSRAWCCQL